MPNFFQQLIAPVQGGGPLARVFVAIAILVFGHLGVKLLNFLIKRLIVLDRENLNKKQVEKRHRSIRYISYALDGLVIITAIFYLNADTLGGASSAVADFIPELISGILIAILGIIGVNIAIKVGADFLRAVGVKNYFREVGLSSTAIGFLSLLLKGFLYLLVMQIALSELGIGETFLGELVRASSWAVAFLIAGLVFYGFKDLFRNFAAGVYLQNSQLVRPGEEVKLGEEKGEINQVSLFSTSIDTDSGHTLLAPNSELMDANIKFRRTKGDISTLEDIKSYFVAQHPSYCGPAAMEMALEIFGYHHSQQDIGERANATRENGTDVEELMDAVEELTGGDVEAAFVEYDKINSLEDEFKAWFNDGALIVPNFYKPEIFPSQDTYGGHYVLALGVESDEVLVVDPSDRSGSGGVYYVSGDKLEDSMGDFGHKRGYIVVAPEGTTAKWRIENDLIYSNKNYYDELSKTLEDRLRKIIRQGSLLKNAMPSKAEKYIEDWQTEERVTRLWQSREGGNEASEDN